MDERKDRETPECPSGVDHAAESEGVHLAAQTCESRSRARWLLVPLQLYALCLLGLAGCETTQQSAGEPCGSEVCSTGQVCCSPMCGACAAHGSECALACEQASDPAVDASLPGPDAGEHDLCAKKNCEKGMHCKAQEGSAVCVADLPSKPPVEASCDAVECGPGRHCEVLGGDCDAGACERTATCVDGGDDECAGVECPQGEVCSPLHHVPHCIKESEARPCNLTPCADHEYCDDASGERVCTKQPDCEGLSCEPGTVCRVVSSELGCATLPCADQVSCQPCNPENAATCLQFPCTNTHCDEGYFCQEMDGVAHCLRPEDVCLGIQCDAGFHCIPHTVECFFPPCTAVPECVAD
jgi:hypothetical protein